MTSKRNIKKRLKELEQARDVSPPKLFVGWGKHVGLDDEAIATEWRRVVEASAGRDPMATAWIWSLKGKLFDEDRYDVEA